MGLQQVAQLASRLWLVPQQIDFSPIGGLEGVQRHERWPHW